jgi:hypothetical protein
MLPEVLLQIKAVYELRKVLRDGWQIIHSPNEECQSARAVSKQLAMGMLPGVADLILISPKGQIFFLEFKRLDGSLSGEQEAFMHWAIRCGIPHRVCRTVEEALDAFKQFGAMKCHDAPEQNSQSGTDCAQRCG